MPQSRVVGSPDRGGPAGRYGLEYSWASLLREWRRARVKALQNHLVGIERH